MGTNYASLSFSSQLAFYFKYESSTSTSVFFFFCFFLTRPHAGSQMHFFDSLGSLRGQQIPPLQNQYMGSFFTPRSGSPSPGEINKMKGISVRTTVRLHNPYFPQGRAAAIDRHVASHRGGAVNESGPLCGQGSVCVLWGIQHLEPEPLNKHSDSHPPWLMQPSSGYGYVILFSPETAAPPQHCNTVILCRAHIGFNSFDAFIKGPEKWL